MTLEDAANQWGIHINTVMNLLHDGFISGAVKERSPHKRWRWVIPDGTPRPVRQRKKNVYSGGAPGRIFPSEETLDKLMTQIHLVASRKRSLWERLLDGWGGQVTMSTRGNRL